MPIPTVKSVGRLGITVSDGTDPDDEPEILWCDEGEVWLTPTVALVQYAKGAPVAPTLGNSVTKLKVGPDGMLTYRDLPYVKVFDLTSDLLNPHVGPGKATHQVQFKGVKCDGVEVRFTDGPARIAADTIDPTLGAVNIMRQMPVPVGAGVATVVGPEGLSAYDVAVARGFVGTVEEWLLSLRVKGDKGDRGEPGATDSAVANLIETGPETGAAIAGVVDGWVGDQIVTASISRRFVVFGDSWTTNLDGVAIPSAAVTSLGGGASIVKNYGVPGAFLGPTSHGSDPTKASAAQVATANADTSYDRATITDVLVLIGVNNIGNFLPTVAEAASHFSAIKALFPKARCWYVANSRKQINDLVVTNDPWRWYSRLFEGAALAGFETAPFSPMWHWGTARSTYWTPEANVHMTAAGGNAWAKRLAGFLTGGEGWRPYFKVGMTLHPNATTLAAGAAITNDNSVIDGNVLRLNLTVTGMDALSTVTGYQPIIQIPVAYAPLGDYMFYPAGCRVATDQMDWTYNMRVSSTAPGVVELDPRLLNNHAGYFSLRAEIPLMTVRVA